MKKGKQILSLFLVFLLTVTMISFTPVQYSEAATKTVVNMDKKSEAYIGKKTKLKIVVLRNDKKINAKIKWKSTNSKIATVSKKGVITGKKKGKTTIVATVSIGKKRIIKKCKLVVKKYIPAKSLQLNISKADLMEGETIQLKPTIKPAKASCKQVNYKSSNKAIVSVDKKGKIIAKKKGTADITASLKETKLIAKCTIKVSEASVKATKLEASLPSIVMTAGTEAQIQTIIKPEKASKKLKYTSADTYAATVSETGYVKALAQGSTVITVETTDGSNIKQMINLTVNCDKSKTSKPRVCITNDGEIDDKNSYVHLLYYANEMNLVGLVQTSSFAHWAGSSNGAGVTSMGASGDKAYAWPGTKWQSEFINDYAKIYPNLRVHDKNYPTPQYLQSIVKIGNIGYMGDMDEATEGSEHIRKLILDDVPGPLYITAWGGLNTVGRALRDIHDEYGNTEKWESIRQKIYDKVRIYMWYGQDGKNEKGKDPVFDEICAKYYPEMIYVDVHNCNALGWGWEKATTNNQTKNENHMIPEVMTGKWMLNNLEASINGKSKYGSLMDWYVTYGDGTHVVDETPRFQFGENDEWLTKGLFCGTGRDKYDFLGEGDTPTYLPFFDMGLDSLENYGWGSIAGRFVKDQNKASQGITNYYVPENDTIKMSDWANVGKETTEASYDSGARWVTDIMNSFAERAEWGIASNYNKANHKPDVKIKEGKQLSAEAGERVYLTALASDPDGDNVSLKWFQYKEAGTCKEDISFAGGGAGSRASFVVPSTAKSGETIHVLVKATDNGRHQLSYYQRVVITVK